jgi:hypothetical protein
MPLVAIQSFDFIEIGLLPCWYPFYFISIIGPFTASNSRFYSTGQPNNKIVTAAFCGNLWTAWTVRTIFFLDVAKGRAEMVRKKG